MSRIPPLARSLPSAPQLGPLVLALLATLLLASPERWPGALGGDGEGANALLAMTPPEATPATVEALAAGRGFARAAAEQKPILLLVIPADSVDAVRTWQEDLGKSTQKRLAKDFVVIEVLLTPDGSLPAEEPAGKDETPAPWEAARAKNFLAKRLGVLGESPVLAVLDFSGVLLARDDGELPRDSKLRKVLKAALVANKKMAKLFGEVEKGVQVIGLAMKKKKYPDACRAYAAIRAHEIPLDSPPAVARAERYQELKAEYDKQRAVAEKYEKDDDLASAVSEYEQVLAAFPLREWQDELRSRIGVLWRKIYGTPGGLGGGTGGGGR